MGNSFPSNQLTDVGNARILLKREHRYLEDRNTESWIVAYFVGRFYSNIYAATVRLERIFDKDGNTMFFQILNMFTSGHIKFFIRRVPEKYLFQYIGYEDNNSPYKTKFVKESSNEWGGIMQTNVLYHGRENNGHLIVMEQKKKKGDEMPCTVSVSHYFAVNTRSLFRRNIVEAGFSMVVEFTMSNDEFVVSVKGPDQHPSLALLHMFQQVSTTWTWNPMACSHCAAEAQKQHSGVSMSGILDIKNQGIIGKGNGNVVGGNFYNSSYYYNYYTHQRQRIRKAETETDDTET